MTDTDVSGRGMYPPMEMHGRRQIFTGETDINPGNLLNVLNEALMTHNKNRAEIDYLEKYLRGIQPILFRVKDTRPEICNRITVNRANEIVTFKTANFAGVPIQYVSRSSRKSAPKKIDKLNTMMISEGKTSKDMAMAYKMFTCGVAYRLILNDKWDMFDWKDNYDDAPFEIYTPEPKNTFLVRENDIKRLPVMGVTYVYLDDTNVRYTVYTKNAKYVVDGNATTAGKILQEQTWVHNFGMIPLVEYPCNTVYMGAFEPVLPLLDAINTTESNRLDGVEQFIQALLVFEGVDIDREQLLELKDLGAIRIPPSADGVTRRLYYLNEQLDQNQSQTLADALYQEVLQIVGMPAQGNANTGDSSNNGAVIMKNGWWNAEARMLETAGMWELSEMETLKIVLKICEDAGALSGLRPSDVKLKFGRTGYEDKLTKVQSFTMLNAAGCPPEQAFAYSNLDPDPQSAAIIFSEYRKEQDNAQIAALEGELEETRKAAQNNSELNGENQEADRIES